MNRTTTELSADLIHAALRVLSDSGGTLASKDVTEKVGVLANPTGDECRIFESTGYTRWKAVLHLQSIGLVKAGFIQKRKGIWYLTEDGQAALDYPPKKLWQVMNQKYREWKAQASPSAKNEDAVIDIEEVRPELKSRSIDTEEVEALATNGIQTAIRALDPYEFQDLVAALLRGMGYYTPFVSPKGKDGGIDVIAYKDPLGTQAPAILCQVKHRPDTAAGISDVQRLMGALQHGKNVGLFVTSGTFSNDARSAARTSHVHLELVDMTRFIELWIEHYGKMAEDDRALLRLRTIHVLAD